MNKQIELKYFNYDEKVVCPVCGKGFIIPQLCDLIPGSQKDRDPSLDLVISTIEEV